MWNQEASKERPGLHSGARAAVTKKATLQILPCTVSQLLSACQVGTDAFAICDLELNQVSIVGIVRGCRSSMTYNQYFVDDMTGPTLTLKQWINAADSSSLVKPEPGMYVKAHGHLRTFNEKKCLMAIHIRCLKDLNEITSHMLEVVNAHMQLFGKSCDVNMNPLPVSGAAGASSQRFSTIQEQVLHVISQHSVKEVGISFQNLITLLDYISMADIRKSLAFLINEGLVFSTIDDNHFKSTAQ